VLAPSQAVAASEIVNNIDFESIGLLLCKVVNASKCSKDFKFCWKSAGKVPKPYPLSIASLSLHTAWKIRKNKLIAKLA